MDTKTPTSGRPDDGVRRDGSGFRLRGLDVSRVEGFSDAVFAFALTLIVVSVDVPQTWDELVRTLSGFVGFAICFAFLGYAWFLHHTFFRRYGMVDGGTITLNLVLMFVILLFIYPLKFLFRITGTGGSLTMAKDEAPKLIAVYGFGYAAVFVLFLLLYLRAWQRRSELKLDRLKELGTQESLAVCGIQAAIGIASATLALVGGPEYVSIAGWMYFVLGPLCGLVGWQYGKKMRALREA